MDKIDQVLSVASQKVAPPTPPSVKSSEGSTFTLNSTPTSLIDMGELVEELEVVQELDQPTDATGVAKSPTSMLARSLWIKEQEQQRKQRQGEGVKALPNVSASNRSSASEVHALLDHSRARGRHVQALGLRPAANEHR